MKHMNDNQFIEIFSQLKERFFEHGPKIIIIFIITWLALKFLNKVLEKVIRKAIPEASFHSPIEEKKREDTLIKISQNVFSILVWVIALVAILTEFGIPVAPLITGAGVLGVAVGFGSQSLVKDIITGLFIIAENQYRIGDFVCIDDYCGTVEDMTLRVTKLRNFDGTIYYIPNSEIKVASNKSKDYSKVNFTIGVAYDTDIKVLESIINEIGNELAEDKIYQEYILEAPHFLRIDDFDEYAINIRIIGKVEPNQQFLVTGEMRARLKKVFEEKGIEIPYPIRVIRYADDLCPQKK